MAFLAVPGAPSPGPRSRTVLRQAGQTQAKARVRKPDQHGQVIDVLLSMRRDLAAARRFFARAMRAGTIPVEVTTDRAPVYPQGAR